jgi:lipopolysaccharide export LptBFGC system permease protein LptF
VSSEQKKHRGRYPLRIYARLILAIAMIAIVNFVFSKIIEPLVGNYNPSAIVIATLVLLFFAFLFTFLFWAVDTKGTLGRTLGAKDEDRKS